MEQDDYQRTIAEDNLEITGLKENIKTLAAQVQRNQQSKVI